jgi:hypothetical protein
VGGGDTTGHPISAKDWGPTLEKMGFQPISKIDYESELGDIAVFQSWEGHRHGHIQAYDGNRWISDFVQRYFLPSLKATIYQIYRQPLFRE